MIPVLYLPNAADFSTFGLGVLTDTISCEVTEERNGVSECLLKYPVSGQHYELITKECIIKTKPNDTAADQAFRIYRITKPLKGIVTIYGQHISYDLANVPVLPFSTESRSPQLILSQLLAGDTRLPAGRRPRREDRPDHHKVGQPFRPQHGRQPHHHPQAEGALR